MSLASSTLMCWGRDQVHPLTSFQGSSRAGHSKHLRPGFPKEGRRDGHRLGLLSVLCLH